MTDFEKLQIIIVIAFVVLGYFLGAILSVAKSCLSQLKALNEKFSKGA